MVSYVPFKVGGAIFVTFHLQDLHIPEKTPHPQKVTFQELKVQEQKYVYIYK